MPGKNSDLLNRYLHAVKFWLPKAQQQDILAELAEDLQSQIQDREAALGRPLDDADLADILRRRGSPVRVASGFVTEPRLINPAMFPIYRLVLKIVLLWVLLPLFVLGFLGQVFTSPHLGTALTVFFAEAFRSAFTTIGIVTTIFYLLDRYHAKVKSMDDWDPRKLPYVPARNQPSSRARYLTNFTFAVGALVFWAVAMWQRTEFLFSNGLRIALSSVWVPVYWVVILMTAIDAAVDLYCFLNPAATQLRARMRLIADGIGIAVAALFFRVPGWIELTGPHLTPRDIAQVTALVNSGMQISLVAVAIIKGIDAIVQVRRLLRDKPASQSPLLTTS